MSDPKDCLFFLHDGPSCEDIPHTSVLSHDVLSPFSPVDESQLACNDITPRRRLSLTLDESTQSPFSVISTEGSHDYCTSFNFCFHAERKAEVKELFSSSPLGEIQTGSSIKDYSQRKTLLARRLLKKQQKSLKYGLSSKENCPNGLREQNLSTPTRPSSLPTFPLSPCTEQRCSPVDELSSSLNGNTLMKSINSPLERMSLISPSVYHSQCSLRCISVTSDDSSAEVFENNADNLPYFSGSLKGSKLNAEPSGDSNNDLVCPTPVRPNSYKVGDGWLQFSHGEGKLKTSLKRSSPCTDATEMSMSKRPPLPFLSCSNSQDSSKVSRRSLKGTPLLRSQSCCMSPPAPSSPDNEKIGDFSKPYCLPLVKGLPGCADLKSISGETVCKLLSGKYSNVKNFTIVDCRYPYEYNGGHITGATNIWEKDSLLTEFFRDPRHPKYDDRSIYIFHCEFSTKRGPQMSRFLREVDRKRNGMDFPRLYYPEIYLLHKGYKAFYEEHPEFCEPRSYRCMLDECHKEELKHFKQRSKSWTGEVNMRRRIPSVRTRRSSIFSHSVSSKF